MNKNIYRKFAKDNIKKNKSTYLPYMFSSIVMIALFYILYAISGQIGDVGFTGERTMESVLELGGRVAGVFSLIFIFYTNSFLLKQRKKELGLYSVLGMEKKHINKIVFYEILYTGIGSIILGILFGVLFSKLMFAFLLNILKLDTSIKLNIIKDPMITTGILFLGIFGAVMIYNMIKVRKLNPIDLIKGDKKGEKEPKANWIVGLIGLISLGIGYYIALSIKNPIISIPVFFLAVVFVIIGTYLLFTSGSIIILKLLRKNKRFYYNKKHFISVSNMIYRMKQNAVGLANIAILSTAVLLTISTTISLYVGIEDIIIGMFPKDLSISYSTSSRENIDEKKDINIIDEKIVERGSENNVKIKEPFKYYSLSYYSNLDENILLAENLTKGRISNKTYDVKIYRLEDYNKIHGKNLELKEGEIYYYSDTKDFDYNSIKLLGKEYKIKEKLDNFEIPIDSFMNNINIIVADIEEMEHLKKAANKEQDVVKSSGSSYSVYKIYYNCDFDLDGKLEDKMSFGDGFRDDLNDSIDGSIGVSDVYLYTDTVQSAYGSIYFIGIFLGILFMIATVLIIYYKQITEGYEDHNRFKTLQEVGMSKIEVKNTIKSQVLLVFFLPLIASIIHVSVAFPIVSKILGLLGFTNTKLFLSVTGGVILIFALAYSIVYRWTAKVYYKIVN